MPESPEESRLFAAVRPFIAAFGSVQDLLYYVCHASSMTMLVFLRRKLGFRTVSPLDIWLRFFFLMGLSLWVSIFGLFFNRSARSFGSIFEGWPLLFGLAFFGMGFWQRRQRLQEIKRGELWYTYSRGESWLAPYISLRPDLVQRIVDPLVCIVAAFAVVYFSKILALWFFYCAFTLAICEQIVADKVLHRVLDVMDAILVSEVSKQDYRYFKGGGMPTSAAEAQEAENKAAEERGFATNPQASDILRSIERRKRREQEEGEAGVAAD